MTRDTVSRLTLLDGPLGAASEVHAPAHWRCVDLISDLHLGPATPATAAALERYLTHTRADAIFLLGDIFEVWIGDDTLDDPENPGGTEARILRLLGAAARQRPLGLMVGNRDFLLGAAAAEMAGWIVLPDACVLQAFGQRTVLLHGDAQCLADTDYQRFRAQVRGDVWQQAFLALPMVQRREIARSLRDNSEHHKREHGFAGYADLDPAAMTALLARAGARRLVHGHTHRPGDEPLGNGLVRHVLTDWDCEPGAQPPRAEVLRLSADGVTRLPA